MGEPSQRKNMENQLKELRKMSARGFRGPEKSTQKDIRHDVSLKAALERAKKKKHVSESNFYAHIEF